MHYLRNSDNYNICFIEHNNGDFEIGYDIMNYSYELLEKATKDALRFMKDIDDLWVFRENWRYRNVTTEISIDKYISDHFEKLAKKWNLIYITD